MINRLLMSGLAALAAVGLTATPASAAPPNCAGVRASEHTTQDGEYTIFPLGRPGPVITVFCYGMRGTPKEYLSLRHTGSGQNFAQYTAGGAAPGTNVVTRYTKVRLDPTPVSVQPFVFRVNIADQTFSRSTGRLLHGPDEVTSMPYAIGFDCAASGSATGRAQLDLRGTLFRVVNTFRVQGFHPAGRAAVGSNGQVARITGGGFCGWNAPAETFNPYNTNPLGDPNGGWDLRLALL
jgi:GON domain